ncbi:MAG: UDP-N-acetylmuramate--L-alanine ligase [Chloroflexia bacterium]|nr:UDP-N-acetylmuramate--L-alanine ligase [Chloroflexia bacterium]
MHYHIVGIGGAGMSAIAHILLDCGNRVSGSDANQSTAWAPLQARGVTIYLGHAASQIAGADTVLATSAVHAPHPELDAAVAMGIPVMRRHDLWTRWSQERRVIAVAGTHGKTTTSAMIAHALQVAGMNPGYLIGAEVPDLPHVACWGDPSAPLVIEADEYDRTFLALRPDIAVITTIEWDHVDIYASLADYAAAFATFSEQISNPERVLVCGDDAGARAAITRAGVRWYGIDTDLARDPVACSRIPLDWAASALHHDASSQSFQAWHYDRRSFAMRLHRPLTIPLAGLHNVKNAVAAYAAAVLAGAAPESVAQALATFQGARRRFEYKGSVAGVTVIDDYGHHPTEVAAVLAAARARYLGQRIIAYVQPHTYSRTVSLVAEWATAFVDADVVCIGDIYASREDPLVGIDAAWLVRHITHPLVQTSGTITQSASLIADLVRAGDVVITMSAGDGTQVGPRLLRLLEQRHG